MAQAGGRAATSKGVSTVRYFRRARNDDGAAAVEFALLFPIFMILALGIMTAGTAFSRQINITQAAREASRYGATLDISGMNSALSLAARTQAWLDSTDIALTQSAGNRANPIAGYDYRCVAIVKVDPVNGAVTGSYKETVGTSASTYGTGACPSTTTAAITAANGYVQTVLSRDISFFVLFINPTLHLDAVSVTPYEGKVE
jgi:Flp pilus assembly protein TadG